MLIWIDASVLNADFAKDLKAAQGIADVFGAAVRGEHYVLADRNTLREMAADINLSSATRTVISTIQSQLATLGSIKTELGARIRITYGDGNAVKRTSATEWEIPLHAIATFGTKKTALITENLEDAEAFEHAAKQYQASAGFGGHVVFEKIPGGGSTTPKVFTHLADSEKRWCLCITDSDRLCPSDNMDTTASKCHSFAKGCKCIAFHKDLDEREIENILPFAFVDEVIPPSHRDHWDWYTKQVAKRRPDVHDYCDLKLGTTRKSICTFTKDSPRHRYWTTVIADLTGASTVQPATCDDDSVCQDLGNRCPCTITPGYGEKLLNGVLALLAKMSPHEAHRRIKNDPKQATWLAIGRTVFEFGCAPEKIRL